VRPGVQTPGPQKKKKKKYWVYFGVYTCQAEKSQVRETHKIY
jgi:hypothetical protein